MLHRVIFICRWVLYCRRSAPAWRVSVGVSGVFCALFVGASCATNLASRAGLAVYVLLINVLGVVSSRDEEATRRRCFALRIALRHSVPRLPPEVRARPRRDVRLLRV